ncbi:MAG: hypothetical protein AAB866_00020 [Patescibacteria group bacterium]
MKIEQIELSFPLEEIYRTSHFSLERTLDNELRGFVDFSVLNPNGFDLVQEIGFGISEPLPSKYWDEEIKKYIDKLKIARTEVEKDKILYDMYFLFGEIIDSYC